jgi:DNA modification methylase
MTVNVINGDCRTVLPTLYNQFDLAFMDPPFNINEAYHNYQDNLSREDYETFIKNIVIKLWHNSNVICLHGNDDLADIYLAIARRLNMSRIAWVNLQYNFGQCTRINWIDARCHCLIYCGVGETTYEWNPDSVLVESARSRVYNDPRINETARGGYRLPGTVWGTESDGPYWGRVVGNSAERRAMHPNQLPEVYLERLIRAYTSPGDHILDPFGGSGTTAVVADALARHCTTVEVSQLYCASIRQRVSSGAVRVTPTKNIPESFVRGLA